MTSQPVELFYSYSHKDEDLRDQLETHLTMLERTGLIREWHDRRINAGDDWGGEIDQHLNSADVILLLVSPDFLASSYCYDIEMTEALKRHESRTALVVPVILRPCDWTYAPFSKLQALPRGAKAVTLWTNQDEAFLSVAEGIREAVEKLRARRAAPPEPPDEGLKLPPPHSIPRPPALGFVSRRDKQGRDIVERLKEELAPGRTQLVTLSGPGGIGKTTLAAEAARALLGPYRGRVVWSTADGRADFNLLTLLDDIATQLGRADLRTLAPDAKKVQVRALVADPPALVVLDNFETVAPDARRAIEEWFTHTPCASLFTSRPPIADTLPVPVSAMSRAEADEFLDKLIEPMSDTQIFSAEVRQRVYETAEANPFVMTWVVAQIGAALQEPDTVFKELAEGEGDAAQRVFDRSCNLPQLGDDGRAALLALSLFTPSASREALAEVAGFGDDTKRLNEAVKNLHALWLIKAIDQNRRLTVEGLTRSLAAARLSKDSRATDFRQRFVTYFLHYAEAHLEPTPEDYDALEVEKNNLLSALDVGFGSNDWVSVSRLMVALNAGGEGGWLSVRGYWDEALIYGKRSLNAARALKSLWHIGALAHSLGMVSAARADFASAKEYYEQSVEIARQLDAKQGLSASLHELGKLAHVQGDLDEAQRLYAESLEISRRLGDQNGIAITIHNLAALAQRQNKLDEARQLYSESLEISRRLGNQSGIAISLQQLGRLAQDAGEVKEARRLFGESLEIKKRLGNQSGIATSLHQLGLLAEDVGNREEAARLFREALTIFEKLGSPNAEVSRRCLKRVEGESS